MKTVIDAYLEFITVRMYINLPYSFYIHHLDWSQYDLGNQKLL